MPEPNQPLLETAMWLQQSFQTRALAVRTQVRAAKLLLHRLADIFTALAELASKSERTRRQWIDDPVLEIGAREKVGPNDQILHNAEHWLEIACSYWLLKRRCTFGMATCTSREQASRTVESGDDITGLGFSDLGNVDSAEWIALIRPLCQPLRYRRRNREDEPRPSNARARPPVVRPPSYRVR
jgi:hypothetical protein